MRLAFILTAVVLLPAIAFSQTTWYVPDDFPGGIQAAIADPSVVNGDTIIVRPGIYVENIDFLGKAITVKSEQGAVVTTIDGNQAGSVVTFQNGEGLDSVVDGFTITNGYAIYDGGGINCVTSSPTITNNTVSGNTAGWGGGGICCVISSSTINNNTIMGNSADEGGGIYCGSSSSTITNNTITGNTAWGGGGIFCYNSSPTVTSNIISGNTATLGGGIFCDYSSPTIINDTITENTAGYASGGIDIYCCVFAPTISNTILWDNSAPTGKEISLTFSSALTINYSDVEGGQSSVHVDPGCTLNWGAGMIDADPLFVAPHNSDFHITFDSPCRSAGDRNAPNLPETDFEGDPRIGHYLLPDIGADEFYTHFYINGEVSLGENVTGVIVGWPKTSPVVLISGKGIRSIPMTTPYGDFWLKPPWNHRNHFYPIPDNGVRLIPRIVSSTLPPGTEIPVQALVGTELSNLWIIRIE